MHYPYVNLAAHWPSVVKLDGSNSQVRLTQFDDALVESHPQEIDVYPESSVLLQSYAVVNDEHEVGFVRHWFPVDEQPNDEAAHTVTSTMSVHLEVFTIQPNPFVTQLECHVLQSASVLSEVGALVQTLFE